MMKWSENAEQAVSRAPFFVRKRIRRSVEAEATRCGASIVDVEHVDACRHRMLTQPDNEIEGYRIETCFGFNGCPNLAFVDPNVVAELEQQLVDRDLKGFLKSRIRGPLRWHHEFRVSISACPNACSQPQIVDFGLIGARLPAVGAGSCNGCGACTAVCREGAVSLEGEYGSSPRIDGRRCLACGQCINACPDGVLVEAAKGFRVLLGGKLGRHPQLGGELPGIFASRDLLLICRESLDFYLQHNIQGERFGEILRRTAADILSEFYRELAKASLG